MAFPLVQRLARITWNEPPLAVFVCARDTSGFTELIHASFCDSPNGSYFLDCHDGIPPLLLFKNIIAIIPNKINYIVPNKSGVVRIQPDTMARKAIGSYKRLVPKS